jgi:hypothetical protein
MMTKVWIVVRHVRLAAPLYVLDVFSDSAAAEKVAETVRLAYIEKMGENASDFVTIEILEKEVHTTTTES